MLSLPYILKPQRSHDTLNIHLCTYSNTITLALGNVNQSGEQSFKNTEDIGWSTSCNDPDWSCGAIVASRCKLVRNTRSSPGNSFLYVIEFPLPCITEDFRRTSSTGSDRFTTEYNFFNGDYHTRLEWENILDSHTTIYQLRRYRILNSSTTGKLKISQWMASLHFRPIFRRQKE